MGDAPFVIDDVENVEGKMLEGMKAAFPGLYIDPENRVIMLNRNRKDRVALLCGSGCGYEPFGEGFVGEGMLTAFIAGSLLKPPPTKIISKVIHNLAMLNKGGIVVLLLNYPKQVLNFGLAIEKARLKGIMIESYVITDDCSRTDNNLIGFEVNLALRRGLCGCAFVFKILGAMSSLGYKLWEILEHAMMLNFRNATMSFVLSSGTHPVTNRKLYPIPKGEIAVGGGVQFDKGVDTIKGESIKDVIGYVVPKIVELSGAEATCCVMVNNMGISTNMELYIIANEIDLILGELDISIERMYVGAVMTSLNTRGVMISILNCSQIQNWLCYLDMPTESFGWPGSRLSYLNPKWPLTTFVEEEDLTRSSKIQPTMILSTEESHFFHLCLSFALKAIIEAEYTINRLNSLTSNGDCGTNMSHFSKIMLDKLADMPCKDVSDTFYKCSLIVDGCRAGTIGTIYAIALNGASMDSESWASCWENAIKQIVKHTSVKPGFRTLLDSLMPSYEIFVEEILKNGEDRWLEALEKAVEYAKCGCYMTSQMKPKVGRAKFIPENKICNMDAGAFGVYVWLNAVYTVLLNSFR